MVDKLHVFQEVLRKRTGTSIPLTQEETVYFEEKIHQFQHERLVHLVVTMTVGLATLATCMTTLFSPIAPLFFADALLLILFIAYIIHYRALENGVQKTYELLDEVMKK